MRPARRSGGAAFRSWVWASRLPQPLYGYDYSIANIATTESWPP